MITSTLELADNRPINFFHLIFLQICRIYVGFAPLGDFVNILGDSKKVDFGRHFWVQIDLF